MELNRKRLRSRPTLVKQEKIGIAIIVLIAMIDAVAIYYFISLYDLPSHGFLVSLSGWMQDHIICSDSWIKASISYTDRVHFIYLVAVCSIVLSCFVVITTTPRGQLLQWSKDADARHILFHL